MSVSDIIKIGSAACIGLVVGYKLNKTYSTVTTKPELFHSAVSDLHHHEFWESTLEPLDRSTNEVVPYLGITVGLLVTFRYVLEWSLITPSPKYLGFAAAGLVLPWSLVRVAETKRWRHKTQASEVRQFLKKWAAVDWCPEMAAEYQVLQAMSP